MTQLEHMFRRNLIVAGVMHGLLVLGVLVFEFWTARTPEKPVDVQLFVPADLLGDMPKGSGYGRGAYAPPPPAGGGGGGPAEASLAPSPTRFTPEERPAPSVPEPGQIQVPKPAPAKPKNPTVARTSTSKSDPKKAKTSSAKSTKPPSTAKTTTAAAKGKGRVTGPGTGTGSSAKAIRNRFAEQLKAAAGGTQYGDGHAPGGGQGRGDVIGSPNGSPDGIVGGVGKGSPFWWYYQHVHDRMYEAWEQPGAAVNYNKNLVTMVRLRVARDGTVLEAKLVGGSGNKIMDDSAVSAARSVDKLKPLPDGLTGFTTDITVNFRLEG